MAGPRLDSPDVGIPIFINVAAVVYLLISKRLFGLRGGRKAYDEERRGLPRLAGPGLRKPLGNPQS